MSAELAVVTARPPMSITEKMEYARTLAGAELLPKHFQKNPANVLWAIEYGEALRLPTIAAITGVHVMDGKPTPSAALMSALVRRAGHRLRVGYEPSTEHGIRGRAWCVIIRSDDPDFPFRTEWTVERAADAELCQIKDGKVSHRTHNGKTGNWQKHPVAMMKARAISECARDACEEALMGMHYTAEELGAELDEDGTPLRATASVTPLRTDPNHASSASYAEREAAAEDEPAWDARIAQCERDRDRTGLVDLWKQARAARPEDVDLHARITDAGGRVKAAVQAETDAEPLDVEVVGDPLAMPAEEKRRHDLLTSLLAQTDVADDDDRAVRLMAMIAARPDITSAYDLTHEERGVVVAWLDSAKQAGEIDNAFTLAQEEAAEAERDDEQGDDQ